MAVEEIGAAASAASTLNEATKEPVRMGNLVRRKKQKAVIGKKEHVYTPAELLAYGFATWIVLLLLFLVWWKPYLGVTGGATGVGLIVGFVYAYLYFMNCKRKDELQQLLSMDPGLKGCQYLLGRVPDWISLTDREKMEWLNRMLSEMWPYYDRGVCSMVKEIVEPIMEQYRPPGVIKKMYFSELTFGDAPFRVEGIAVKDDPDCVDIEVDVRWCGDANIGLAFDLPLPGNFVSLTSKVKDIVFVATIKVLLKPLVEKIPGFAAIAIAIKSPPIIKYRLDFGVLPAGISSVLTAPLISFVNFIVNEVLVGMLLWPKRFTLPILSWDGVLPANDPEIDLQVERLEGRPQGVIRVHVIRAKDLKSFDTLSGKSDPFVEIFTTMTDKVETKVIKSNLNPLWDEVKYLPVVEKDQVLKLEMFDWDAVNIKEGLTLKVWQSANKMVGAKEFMARAAIPLAEFIRQEGVDEEGWYPLGRGDWTDVEGPGKGEGMIRLGMEYRSVASVASLDMKKATIGMLLVTVIQIHNLNGGAKDGTSCKVVIKIGKDKRETSVLRNTNNLRWAKDNKFIFHEVDAHRFHAVDVEVVSAAGVVPGVLKESLGEFAVPVGDILENKQVSRWTKKVQNGYLRKAFDLFNGDGSTLDLEIEFLPYW